MPSFTLNEKTLKVEKENGKALIEGFEKNGKKIHTSIFVAHEDAISLVNNFNIFPKLIDIKVGPNRPEYIPSIVGKRMRAEFFNRGFEYKYVAILDTIYHTVSTMDLWGELCNDGTFDIWNPISPYKCVETKKDPMILLIRACEIDNAIPSELINRNCTYYGQVMASRQIRVSRPIIDNETFKQIKNNLELKLSQFNRRLIKQECKNTYNLFV